MSKHAHRAERVALRSDFRLFSKCFRRSPVEVARKLNGNDTRRADHGAARSGSIARVPS
jgi:hypothetical protein